MSIPEKPSRLALWIDKYGSPNEMKIEYIQTGTDTAETKITLQTDKHSIIIGRYEFSDSKYDSKQDVYLCISHCSLFDLTDNGRKKLEEWKSFNKKEARDLSEYKRLQAKFGNIKVD